MVADIAVYLLWTVDCSVVQLYWHRSRKGQSVVLHWRILPEVSFVDTAAVRTA
jgi:hypothetical protein